MAKYLLFAIAAILVLAVVPTVMPGMTADSLQAVAAQSGDRTDSPPPKANDGQGESPKPSQDPPKAPHSVWFLLATIVIAGGFGGFVDGLSTKKSYQFTFGTYSKELGSVGDLLVGMAAAVAIFAVAGSVFSLPDDKDIYTPMGFLKLVAWGVLSGYLGTRLLDRVSSEVVQKIAVKAAREEVKEAVAQNETVQQNIREAEQEVSQFLAKRDALTAQKDEKEAAKLLDHAVRKYELVLKTEPANAAAHIGLANTYSYKAEFRATALQKNAGDMWAKAIDVAGALIKQDSQSSKAYYNRACYKALANDAKKYSLADIVGDLKRAIEIDPNLKAYAQDDQDFVGLRGKKEFDELIPPKAVT